MGLASVAIRNVVGLPSGLAPKLSPHVTQVLDKAVSEPAVGEKPVPAALPFLNTRITQAAQSEPHLALMVEDAPRADIAVGADGPILAAGPRLDWRVHAMCIWLLGMATLSIWLLVKLRRLGGEHPAKAQAASLPQSFHDQLTECAKRLNLRRKPVVVVTDNIQTPAVFGLFRPVLLMPVGYIRSLSRKDTEYLLLHELAHIKRGDLLTHSLCIFLQVVYWYNPLLWLVRRRLRHLRELCCDATVASLLRDRTSEYRRTLLEAARQFLCTPVEYGLGLVGLFEDSNCLISRINWLEKPIWRYQRMKKLIAITIIGVMLVCVLPMAVAQQDSSPGPAGTGSDAEQQESREQLLKAKQDLEAKLRKLEFEMQKLRKELQAVVHAEHANHATAGHAHQAAGHTEQASHGAVTQKTKEAKDKAAKAGDKAQQVRDKVARARALAEARKADAQAEHWEQWAKHMENWAQGYEQWAESDEFKKWQKDMQKWAQEIAKTQTRIRGGVGSAAGPAPTPRPMPVMPPMPSMPAPVAPMAPGLMPHGLMPPSTGTSRASSSSPARTRGTIRKATGSTSPQAPSTGILQVSASSSSPARTLLTTGSATVSTLSRDIKIEQDKNGKYVATTEMHFVSKVNPGVPFVVRNSMGRIILRPSKDGKSDVRAVIRGKAKTAAEAQAKAGQVSIHVNSSQEKYFLEPVKNDGGKWDDLSVDLHFAVPPGVLLDVKTNMGSVELHDLEGKIKAVSDMGAIKAVNTTGDVELTTKMGAIQLVAPKNLSAKLSAQAKMGSIQSDLPLEISKRDMFRTSAEGTLGTGDGSIRMTSDMGSIKLKWQSPSQETLE
ncbi:MAG: M56 family metallopeptidase [Planctomycetota bacterium]